MQPVVRVGVGVFVYRNGNILLGERLGAHGAGTWALPGGHLEFGETPAQCAQREVLEETGLEIDTETFEEAGFTTDIFEQEGKHYVTLFMRAGCHHGQPQLMEPGKCRQWQWFSLDNLPSPLFRTLSSFLEKYPAR